MRNTPLYVVLILCGFGIGHAVDAGDLTAPKPPAARPLGHDPGQKFVQRQGFHRLFKILNIAYIDTLEYADGGVETIEPTETDYYRNNAATVDADSERYGHQVSQGKSAPTYVRWIGPDIGYGLFAHRAIKAGHLIAEYTGVARDFTKMTDSTYAWMYPFKKDPAGNAVQYAIDSRLRGNEMRFVNHSYTPNTRQAWIIVDGAWHIIYVAREDIPQDAQLSINYGSSYWQTRNKDPLDLE